MIVFVPDQSRGQSGPIAIGDIRADGSYSLKTGDAFGAAPGWYRVTVAAVGPPGIKAIDDPYAVPVSLIPDRYRDPELSGLSCEVKPNKANVVDFNLD